MKNIILIITIALISVSCQEHEQRYFADSDEINTLKTGINAYESGDWDQWKSHFADTAKIYVNSKDHVNLSSRLQALQEMTNAFASYGFDKEKEHIEMVIDKNDETWVYYWATHNGTMVNDTKLTMPVHLAVQFANGKIVEEHIYFDATAMNAAIETMQEAEAMEETEVSEE